MNLSLLDQRNRYFFKFAWCALRTIVKSVKSRPGKKYSEVKNEKKNVCVGPKVSNFKLEYIKVSKSQKEIFCFQISQKVNLFL